MDRSEGDGYEAQIRTLKLLSKSQTALLKAYLSKKLKEAEDTVSRAADFLDGGRPDASKAKDLRQALKALRLHELDVDVSSVQIPMHQELALLRAAAENGSLPANAVGAKPAAQSSAQPSAEIQKHITSLEAENSKLRELLKEAQKELSAKSAAPTASAPAAAELHRYKQEVDMLKDQIHQLTVQNQDKDQQLLQQANRVDELTKAAQDKRREQALADEVGKLKAQLSSADATHGKALKDQEAKLQAKLQELQAAHARKVQELEAGFAAEREEMEQALAEELEEMETTKDGEIQALQAEATKLRDAHARLQKANSVLSSSLRKLADSAARLKKDYRAKAKENARELAEYAGSIKSFFAGSVLQKLRGLGEEMRVINQRYRKEMSERKRLHNLVQELKGNIRVYMRCRPPSQKELEGAEGELCVSFPNPGEVRVVNEKNREKLWEFDEVFDWNTTQPQVYEEVSALVTSVLDGFNVCIFAYGQTGSGKTFTMSGPADNRGVNTRALEELFTRVRDRTAEYEDVISVSLLEVYNEEIHDLLVDRQEMKLEVKMGEYGNYVPGLSQVPVDSIDAVFQLIAQADRNRSSATTNMNEHSSRSHMMLTVTLVSVLRATGVATRGKLNLVDLAGSERINKSGAQGQALKEAQNINKSLSALGDVIAARAQKQGHIPFRNSTLTFLLQDSLSQDSKTLMIVCISPVMYNSEETYCSLNFAARVRTVELGRASKNLVAGGGQTSAGGSVSTKASVGTPGVARRTSVGGSGLR